MTTAVSEEEVKPKLLIVDDEADLRLMLTMSLRDIYKVKEADSGIAALKIAKAWQPSLILMDAMMPGLDGMQTCKSLRESEETKHIPVLMLTALNQTLDRVKAFDLGADDFIAKPFDLEELISRLNSKYIRSQENVRTKLNVLNSGNLKFDIAAHVVTIEPKGQIVLSPAEFGILKLLLENAGSVVTRKDILKYVWEDARKKDRLIDAHVTSLRKKLAGFSGEIQTIYGLGYKLA